jgi:hypothetical protein
VSPVKKLNGEIIMTSDTTKLLKHVDAVVWRRFRALRTGQISASRAGELQLLIEGVLAVRKVRASNAPGRLPTTVDHMSFIDCLRPRAGGAYKNRPRFL